MKNGKHVTKVTKNIKYICIFAHKSKSAIQMMTILLGISYKTAPVKIREIYAFSNTDIDDILIHAKEFKQILGFVIISTCNRTELYARFDSDNESENTALLYKIIESVRPHTDNHKAHFFVKTDKDASLHLMNVSAGLDSMILGEDQIIGQIKTAWNLARDAKTIDPSLDRLFQKSIEAGKRVRAKTDINSGSGSVSSAAIDLSVRIFGNLKNKQAMFIGTGETGELAIHNLIKKGGKRPIITNRTREKAELLAQKYSAKLVDYDKKEDYYKDADIIFIATGASAPVITKKIAEQSMKMRDYKKQIYIDLSVPRNIEISVSEISGIHLYSVDDLQNVVNETGLKRREAAVKAKKIIQDTADEYENWLSSQKLSPTIQKIITHFDNINNNELNGFKKTHANCDCSEVSLYANHITNKYKRLFIRNLKNITDNGKKTEYMQMLDKLFELN